MNNLKFNVYGPTGHLGNEPEKLLPTGLVVNTETGKIENQYERRTQTPAQVGSEEKLLPPAFLEEV